MTRVEKELVLKDICARLPYGFTVHRYSDNRDITFGKNELDEFSHFLEYSEGKEFKLYLRSMSSMTKEEKEECNKTKDKIAVQWDDYGTPIGYEYAHTIKTFDWLNAHRFDYRGLIPMGLALEATKEMYE